MRLVDYLRSYAIRLADKTAVICGGRSCTYAELWRLVCSRAEEIGSSGQIIPFRASQSIEFIVDYFAVHLAGCAAAPLEKDMPDEVFESVSSFLKSCAVPPGTADILYTTGTTGASKGVMISHEAILANAENLIDAQHYSESLIFIITGPLSHIGSLSKVWPIIMLGGTLYILDSLKDLNLFYSALDSCGEISGRFCPDVAGQVCRKTATFLVPSAIRMLLRFSADRLAQYDGRIDFIETGAAPISREDMLQLCRLLPHARLYNTYASTETGIVSTYNFNDGRCLAGCVGRPMKHSHIHINEGSNLISGDINAGAPSFNDTIYTGEIHHGLIVCGGGAIATGYAGDTGATREVFRDNALYTNDVGFIDLEGMLHIQGRDDDIINIGGYKVAPTEVEDAALSMPGLLDCICIAADHPVIGKALKLLYVRDESAAFSTRDLALHLKSRLETYKVPLLYAFVPRIARTFNGKLDRKAYR